MFIRIALNGGLIFTQITINYFITFIFVVFAFVFSVGAVLITSSNHDKFIFEVKPLLLFTTNSEKITSTREMVTESIGIRIRYGRAFEFYCNLFR